MTGPVIPAERVGGIVPLPLHATLDAVLALALMAGPTLLGWAHRLRAPLLAAGARVAAYSLATRYHESRRDALSFDQHPS